MHQQQHPAPKTVKLELANGGALPEGIKFVVAGGPEIKLAYADGVLTLDVASIKDFNWNDFKLDSDEGMFVTPEPFYAVPSIQVKDGDKNYMLSSSNDPKLTQIFGIAKEDGKIELSQLAAGFLIFEYKAGFNLLQFNDDKTTTPVEIGNTLYLHLLEPATP
ncbi:MAG: hypothetical protein ACRC5H_02350 [Treponemataceae bacterium]